MSIRSVRHDIEVILIYSIDVIFENLKLLYIRVSLVFLLFVTESADGCPSFNKVIC
jgi:hypothetical protein